MKLLTSRKRSVPICGLVAALGIVCVTRQVHAADSVRPNIVYILADDPGYRELGAFGQQKILTPHLDSLAKQGMTRGNTDAELYNITTDIGEQHNVADEHADMGAQLTKLMAEQHHPSDIFPLRPFDQPALNNRAGK